MLVCKAPMTDERSNVVPFTSPWRRQLKRGVEKLRLGDSGGAFLDFERALDQAPDEPEVLIALGRARAQQHRFEEAEDLLRRAMVRRPHSATAAATLARVLGLHLDRPNEAFELLHRALEKNPDAAPLHVIRGELLLEEGAFLDARAAFGRVLDQDLADEAARAGLARSYNLEGITLSDRGEDDPAIFAFKRAADLDPAWSGPCVNLGVVFGRLGKNQKAVEAYERALEREPANPVAHFNLGAAQLRLGNHQDALMALELTLEICPEYPRVRTALGNLLAERGDFDRAIALLLEEIEIGAADAQSWTSLGLAYVCSGNSQRGERCLLDAIALDARHFNAYHTLAALFVAQKRLEEAEAILRAAHAEDPEQAARIFSDRQFENVQGLDRFGFISRSR